MKSSKWGSLLQGAVANLESRLDTILAEEGATKGQKPVAQGARSSSQARKELGAEEKPAPIRTSTDSQVDTYIRTSLDSSRNASKDVPEIQIQAVADTNNDRNDGEDAAQSKTGSADAVQNIAARVSTDSVRSVDSVSPHNKLSVDVLPSSTAYGPSLSDLQAQLAQLKAENETQDVLRQEETNTYLERIDALQAKLQTLTTDLKDRAKATAEEASPDSLEQKLAGKDEQIAGLLEEGQKLSKLEVTQAGTIKKLRRKAAEDARLVEDLNRTVVAVEKSLAEKSNSLARLEAGSKDANTKLLGLARAERDVEEQKKACDARDQIIESLKKQMEAATSQARQEERDIASKALEKERKVAQSLLDDITTLKLEKQLLDDKRRSERKSAEDAQERDRERHAAAEATLRNEVQTLETRLEVLRERNEETSSATIGGDQPKLLRQIELLQSQYSQASENWQGIESSLQARLAAVERERDEASKQESDVRKKAREANSASRRLQDELDETARKCNVLEAELTERQAAATKLQTRVSDFEKTLQQQKIDFEREKQGWESTVTTRIEEEKAKWRQEAAQEMQPPLSRVDSPTYSMRRPQAPQGLEIPSIANRRSLSRNVSVDFGLPMYNRRTSMMPPRTPDLQTNGFESGRSTPPIFNIPETPSIRTNDHDDMFENASSAHHTVNDMLSESTTGAGPSVQLVERMSAAVRRLESEKAAFKDEMTRILSQRNEARKELVTMMKELETKRAVDDKVAKLEKDCTEVKQRYQTTLEMLGEKSEEVEELKADVADLKKIYRELVESTMK